MSHPYSREWDIMLNKLLDKEDNVKIVSGFTARVGGIDVWIGNYPYAYGNPEQLDVRPSRATIERLHKAVIKALINE